MSYPNLSYGGGYASNQQGSSYPGQMQGQQGGYPGQQGAYPGQQGAYPGQQGAYPGQQGAYPGQQGAYPGQQGAYPGQQSGYPSQQGGYPGQQSLGGYGSQGYPGTHPSHPGVSPDVQQWFNTVDSDRSGKISAKELQAALVNGQGKHFSDTACNLMIGMFDQDKSGTIDVNEFQLLFNYINQWIATFKSYDRDDSGNIEEHELSQALQQMGFRFSPEFVKYLITKSDSKNHKNISVDQFIVICVQIQKFTEAFRSRDKDMQGVITIGFEDFLTLALSCSV